MAKQSKYLYLNKGIQTRKGAVDPAVQGAVKVFLKNIYGSTSPIRVNTVNGAGRDGKPVTRTVANVEGSYKVDELMASQLKYFFNADIPTGDFLNIRVAIWNKAGENLAKFNLNEGDLYMFMVRDITLESFNRNNGKPGYQLNAQAFDFEPLRTKRAGGENADKDEHQNQQSYAAPQSAPSIPQDDNYGADDFAAIDDSDDLPF